MLHNQMRQVRSTSLLCIRQLKPAGAKHILLMSVTRAVIFIWKCNARSINRDNTETPREMTQHPFPCMAGCACPMWARDSITLVPPDCVSPHPVPVPVAWIDVHCIAGLPAAELQNREGAVRHCQKAGSRFLLSDVPSGKAAARMPKVRKIVLRGWSGMKTRV